MNRFLACALSVAMLSSAAQAQTVALFDGADGDCTLNMGIGGTAAVDLWINIPVGVRIQSMDVALRGSDNSSGPGNFDVICFIPVAPLPGEMQRTGRGAIEGNTPGSINDYTYYADDPSLPSATSGYEGTSIDILLDTVVLVGTGETPLGSDLLTFAIGNQLPQYCRVDTLPPFPPPGGWEINGLFDFDNGGCTALEVNVSPEPASLALLAFGGLAALRRRH